MAEKWAGDDDHKLAISFLGFLVLLLVPIITLSGPVLISTLVVTPNFKVEPSSDFSSVEVTNVGSASAHQVKLTLVLLGNQTGSSKFSSENATWLKSYDSTANQTVIVANLPRLGEQGVLSVKFDHSTKTFEVWINSNERGYHQVMTKGAPAPSQPVDYVFLAYETSVLGVSLSWVAYSNRDSWIVRGIRKRVRRGISRLREAVKKVQPDPVVGSG
jgi:hypothetical protein